MLLSGGFCLRQLTYNALFAVLREDTIRGEAFGTVNTIVVCSGRWLVFVGAWDFVSGEGTFDIAGIIILGYKLSVHIRINASCGL